MTRSTVFRALAAAAIAAAASPSRAAPRASPGILHQLNSAVEGVLARVSPAVVQISVTGYGPVEGEPGEGAPLARQHAIASGVIVDPDGYIMTNYHVVDGAQRIRVSLAPAGGEGSARDGSRRVYEARVVGTHPEADLALLKIDAHRLPTLSIDGKRPVRQGELVFAVGSPQGLASTATMGVVSSVSRQAEVVSPMVYIQTDAPINPGNSGGPLVDVDGEVVGLNTFILSQSGGSQGLGFAIPASMVRLVYDSLRKYGHVHRTEVGASAQTITPPLAAGLGLPRDWGVVVSDVVPGGPAAVAGLAEGDVVDTLDGKPVDSLAALSGALYLHAAEQPVQMKVLRGAKAVTIQIRGVESKHPVEQLVNLSRAEDHLVAKLGVIGVEVSDELRQLMPALRAGPGVVVAARTVEPSSIESGLQTGDVIRAVNRAPVTTVPGLRKAVDGLTAGSPVVIQIDRAGRRRYLSFEME